LGKPKLAMQSMYFILWMYQVHFSSLIFFASSASWVSISEDVSWIQWVGHSVQRKRSWWFYFSSIIDERKWFMIRSTEQDL
jgi:hypothetical protein